MLRRIMNHKVNGLNDSIDITVMDEPGQGNACHEYNITMDHGDGTWHSCEIKFQNGPINEYGVNGISNEALLVIVEDRLLGFQSGQFACRENALTKLQEVIMWLQKRTLDRVRRGVEGTNQK